MSSYSGSSILERLKNNQALPGLLAQISNFESFFYFFPDGTALIQTEAIMLETEILTTLSQLPDSLKQEVLHYAEFLAEKYTNKSLENISEIQSSPKKRRAGILKGTFVLPLPNNFDEPLEDFQEYME